MELVLKESVSIRTALEDIRFNRISRYELYVPDCWIAMYRKLKGRASLSSAHGACLNMRRVPG